ncbi:TPA: hypothetical protein RG711_003669, partial [Morganella morganii subsp. morganii]|nr:hypothetical protein [Morganella morganii subsp. morganii]
MHHAFNRVQSAQKPKPRQHTRRTALSLFIGGLFCSAAPAWADCTVSGTPNANGGVDMTCEGIGITQDKGLLGNQSNNTVIVQGESTTINGNVYGGYILGSGDVTVTGNTVTFKDNSSSSSSVYGGFGFSDGSGDVTVTGNTVTFNGGSGSHVYGGLGQSDGNITVTGNSVTLNGSSSGGNNVNGGYGYGYSFGSGDVTVTDNSVTLNGSSSGGNNVNGGYGLSDGDVTVTGNSVTFNDGSSGNNVYGGYGLSDGDVTVTGNSVTFNDGSSGNNVYGGYGSGSGDVTVTGNSVTFNGSSSGRSVYGGYGYGDVTVTGNTVNIHDNAKVTGNLYGAFIENTSDANRYDGFTGNTLNFAAAPITLSGEMANFENYNFTVDPALVNTDTALITAQTITFGTNETNMKGGEDKASKIQVVGIKAGNELFADDKFVLMQATGTMSGNAEGLTTNGVAQQGISLLYDVRTDVDTDGKLVTATIIGKEKPVDPVEPPTGPVEPGKPAARVNPQLKSLSEGHLASAMMLTRGADTLAYNTVHT